MELGKQIKKHRTDMGFSQDQLAEKVFVSRQSISNWENDKTYPDVKSLLMLSEIFGISLDNLIKGDLEEMKKQINETDIKELNRLNIILTVLFLLVILTPLLLLKFLGIPGVIIWAAEVAVTMYFAFKAEKFKKSHDIQTYREIIAFINGEDISGNEKIAETAKRPYQKFLVGAAAAAIALIACIIIGLFIM